MGERANIVVKNGSQQVCLYSHWGGEELRDVLKKAMTRGHSRWNDASYLTRIIFCEMVKDDIEGLTGFGIQQEANEDDANYPTIVVDVDGQIVRVGHYGPSSFEEFVGG